MITNLKFNYTLWFVCNSVFSQSVRTNPSVRFQASNYLAFRHGMKFAEAVIALRDPVFETCYVLLAFSDLIVMFIRFCPHLRDLGIKTPARYEKYESSDSLSTSDAKTQVKGVNFINYQIFTPLTATYLCYQ